MKDEENNFSPEQSNENSRNPKEDIPLWLQGLEEETKANRLKAAGETFPIIDDENGQVFEPFEPAADSPEPSNDLLSDEPEVEEADSVPVEDIDEPSPSAELPLEDNIELSDDVSEEPYTFPEEQSPDEDSHQFISLEEPITESTELTDAPSDEVGLVEEAESIDAIPSPELSSYDQPLDEPESVEPAFEELDIEKEFAVDEDTEEISLPSQEFSSEDEDDLEWVNEITEIDADAEISHEEHTKPQNILEIDSLPTYEEAEEFAKETEHLTKEETFLDISEVDIDQSWDKPSSEDEEANSGILEIVQADEQSEFMEGRILSDDEQAFLEMETSPGADELSFEEGELLPDDEELPKWLQRLIAESYPEESEDLLTSFEEEPMDEITKPVQITPPASLIDDFDSIEDFEELESFEEVEEGEEFDLAEELEIIGSIEEEAPAEEPSVEAALEIQDNNEEQSSIEDMSEFEVDEGYSSVFDDTQPVKLPEEEIEEEALAEIEDTVEETDEDESLTEEEPIEWSEEDNLYFNPENGYVIEIPEPLQFARQVLLHGDVSQALDIFKTYISEEAFLDEIKIWLSEVVDTADACLSEIWESLGDIAASQDNHKEALAAYSKAINYLLVNKDNHGTC